MEVEELEIPTLTDEVSKRRDPWIDELQKQVYNTGKANSFDKSVSAPVEHKHIPYKSR